MRLALVLLFATLAYTTAQDTFRCPDGWEIHDMDNVCKCFLFGKDHTKVTHADATALCAGHGDAWLAEVEDGGRDNGWLVGQLMNRLNKQPMKNTDLGFGHYEDQWWLGAKSYSHHNEHQPGSWTWEHLNATVDWFDWAPHEPDDYHRQQCLTYLRYQYDPFYQTYEWNDWDCNDVADYICERLCD